jgi:lipopolysaccharide export system permease protein
VAGVLVVVVGIFLIRRFGALLDEAAEGAVPLAVLFELLGLRTLMAMPSLLPVIIYLAVMIALGRLYRDAEMTALAACGVGPLGTRAPVLGFALVAAIVVALLSFSIRPWAARRFDVIRTRALGTVEMARMSPGRFYVLDAAEERVVFAEGRAAEDAASLEHVFVHERRDGDVAILAADRALEQRDPQGRFRFLTLRDGRRYDLDLDDDDVEITSYGQLVIRAPLATGLDEEPDHRAGSAAALLRSSAPADQAELQWRLAMPVSTLLLVVLALPLAPVRPRTGKHGQLFVAILFYVVYRQLLGTAKNWIADGALGVFPGLWIIHAACLGCAVALLARERARPSGGTSPAAPAGSTAADR